MTFSTYFDQRYSHLTGHARNTMRAMLADAWDSGIKSGIPTFASVTGGTEIDAKQASSILAELVTQGTTLSGLNLAAQLLGVAACSSCGFRQTFCRCQESKCQSG